MNASKEEDVEPVLNEGIRRHVRLLIGLPERLQEVGVIAKPAFSLDEVEEHATVEKLQRIIVRPPGVLSLTRQVRLQSVKNCLVVVEEPFCDGFNVEGFLVAVLDVEGRNGFDYGADGCQIEHGTPFGRGAEFLMRADCDAAEQAAFFRIFYIVFDIDEVPIGLPRGC